MRFFCLFVMFYPTGSWTQAIGLMPKDSLLKENPGGPKNLNFCMNRILAIPKIKLFILVKILIRISNRELQALIFGMTLRGSCFVLLTEEWIHRLWSYVTLRRGMEIFSENLFIQLLMDIRDVSIYFLMLFKSNAAMDISL